jgi:hypothetical protein
MRFRRLFRRKRLSFQPEPRIPIRLQWQPVAVTIIQSIEPGEKILRFAFRNGFYGASVALHDAGIRAHHSLPLRLGYFIFSDFEGFRDPNAMCRLFVVLASVVACGTAHHEFAGLNPDELDPRGPFGLQRFLRENRTRRQGEREDDEPESLLSGLHSSFLLSHWIRIWARSMQKVVKRTANALLIGTDGTQ